MARGSKKGEHRGGRKKGTKNLRTRELDKILERLVPNEWLIKKLKKLADDGDARCATYLADRKWGRMPQPLGTSEGDECPVVTVFVSGKGPPI